MPTAGEALSPLHASRRAGRFLNAILAALALLAFSPAAADALELRQGQSVRVGPGELVEDDLYAFGADVIVQGRVTGDVVAAGGNVLISGQVLGDVIATGGNVTVSGQVDGSVRAAGGSLVVSGTVGEDALLGSGGVNVNPQATIGRDLLVGSGATTLAGEVGRRAQVGGGDFTLSGRVGESLITDVETLRFTETAFVGGDLIYTRDPGEEVIIPPGAAVQGQVLAQERLEQDQPLQPANEALEWVLGWLRGLVGMLVLGLALVLLFPGFSRRAVGTLRRSPWASLGLGAALLVGVPILAVALFVGGLFVGGWWLGPIALALYVVGLALGLVVAGMALGRWILDRTGRGRLHLVWALLLGLALLLLVGIVPIVGAIVILAALLLGLGALVLALWSARTPEAALPAA